MAYGRPSLTGQPSPQAATQLRESDQQQTQAIVSIHPIVGEQAQILEHVVAQVMGLIRR